MAKMTVKGLDEFIAKVEQLGRRPEGYVKRSLYAAAGVVADEITTAITGLPVDNEYATKKKKRHVLDSKAKEALLDSFGISKMREGDGKVSVSVGFEGRQNQRVMRRIESGTSITEKYPTIRPAVNRSKKAAIAAAQEQFAQDVKELFDGAK